MRSSYLRPKIARSLCYSLHGPLRLTLLNCGGGPASDRLGLAPSPEVKNRDVLSSFLISSTSTTSSSFFFPLTYSSSTLRLTLRNYAQPFFGALLYWRTPWVTSAVQLSLAQDIACST